MHHVLDSGGKSQFRGDVAARPEGTMMPPAVAPSPSPLRTRTSAKKRRGLGKAVLISLVAGLVILLGAALWTPIGVPAVVKFPTNTNVTVAYTGSMVTYVNPSTGATLSKPISVPLTITRKMTAVPGSTSGVALVKESVLAVAGGIRSTQVNVYALDRRTMQSVSDPRAYTFSPGNNPSRASSYYVTLPMGLTSSSNLAIWKPESGTTYMVHPLTTLTPATPSTINGMSVMWFTGTIPMTPAPAYERAALAAQGLPMYLTPTEVQAQLSAAGVSVSKLAPVLIPKLTPAETTKLLAALGAKTPLQYFIYGSGLLAAERQTGAEIKLQSVVDGVAVRPDPAALAPVMTILKAHQSVPGVSAALAVLGKIASAPPQPAYELRYTQTPATVATMITLTRNQINQMNIATLYIPIGAGILGLLLLTPAAVTLVRRRRAARHPGTTPQTGPSHWYTRHHHHHHHRAAA